MKLPKFTVIIPAYNRQEFLDEAIASVCAQTLPDFELIVVDDHSPIPLTVPDDPRITLLRNETNFGKSVGVNRGLWQATGEYVAFLDDDDVWGPHRLANAERAHRLSPIAVCRQVDFGKAQVESSGAATVRRRTDRENARLEMPGSMNTVTVGRGVCPPFDSALRGCEDIEWGIRLQERSSDVAVIESDDSFFRIHVGPRHRNGRRVRLDASMQLLGLHARHYRAHPQQKAYRLFRIGYMYFEEQEFREAFRYAIASLFLRPNRWAMALVKDIVAKYLTATRRQGKSGVARC